MSKHTQEPGPAPDLPQELEPPERAHRATREPPKISLNLTSMIDVIFQLLIYFVVTASFTVGEGALLADMPSGTGEGETDEMDMPEKLYIRLTPLRGLEVEINAADTPVRDFTELQQHLETLAEGIYPTDTPVIIEAAAPRVPWQHMMNAYNAAMTARYETISFAQPTFDGG
jgi:biopolymer transport protein ExbD